MDRPIIFGSESVKAILEGRKTQTRRVVKDAPADWMGYKFHQMVGRIAQWVPKSSYHSHHAHQESICPYGKVGDEVWVRESFRELGSAQKIDGQLPWRGSPDICVYKSDGDYDGPWRSPIHMPRWASRITLEITGVRVERLEDISEADAQAEGVEPSHYGDLTVIPEQIVSRSIFPKSCHRYGFGVAWDKINGKKHPWASNPWVWAVEFRVLK